MKRRPSGPPSVKRKPSGPPSDGVKRKPSGPPSDGVKQAKTSSCTVSLWSSSGSNINSELYKGVADWSAVWERMLHHMGPRGSFRLKGENGRWVVLSDSTNCINDYCRVAESVSNRFGQATLDLVSGEYHMMMLQDNKQGLSLVFDEGDPNENASQRKIKVAAQQQHQAGFIYNTPLFLTEWIKEKEAVDRARRRKEPSHRIWGELWPRSFLKPVQCKSCKAITTVLGAHLLQWPIYIDDTCFTCHQRFSEDGVTNCSRCHTPIFDSETKANIRYQMQDNSFWLWCENCSVRFGDNFTAG